MDTKEQHPPAAKTAAVPVAYVICVVVAFALGLVVGLVWKNALEKRGITLSTPSLISFVITVALGSASTVLALVAIAISRSSEAALVRRSEEGIRLQNEVFTRTTEVLSGIQASTGVTEKRIEDIISGRASVIVTEAVDRALPRQRGALPRQALDKVKKDIAESLRAELLPLVSRSPAAAAARLAEAEARQEEQKQIEQHWSEFRQSITDRLASLGDVKVISAGEGDISSEDPSAFWDAVCEVSGRRVAIDVHTRDQVLLQLPWAGNPEETADYVRRLTWRVVRDNLSLAFIVLDKDAWSEEGPRELAAMLGEFDRQSKTPKFVTLAGDANSVAQQIHSICTQDRDESVAH